MFVNSKNIELQRTTQSTSVSDDPVSKLRYFFYCMCNVVPQLNENGQFSQIINYQKYLQLNNSQADSLVQLCRASFSALDDKCIFLAPQLCKQTDNQFFNIKQVNNLLAVVDNVVVGGRVQNVKKIMVYNESWITRNLINPIKQIQARKTQQVITINGCQVM